jgi:hypothetical protein
MNHVLLPLKRELSLLIATEVNLICLLTVLLEISINLASDYASAPFVLVSQCPAASIALILSVKRMEIARVKAVTRCHCTTRQRLAIRIKINTLLTLIANSVRRTGKSLLLRWALPLFSPWL